jgi:trbM protein of DNA transfer system
MKKSLGLLIAALLGAAPATYADDVLTGDTRLACEAILCLSSGDRPSECASSIRRYFSIRHKKLGNTIKARRNFLKMCPSSSESAEMSGLVDAIANGAGRCDAQELNRMMRYSRFEKVCEQKTNIVLADNIRLMKIARWLKSFTSDLINRNTARLITTTDGRLRAIKYDMSAKRRMVVAG